MKTSVDFVWDGVTYSIPDSEVFEVAEKLESILPFSEMEHFARAPNVATMARLFAVLIAQAGGRIDPRDIRRALISEAVQGTEGRAELAASAQSAQAAVLAILMDGAPQEVQGGGSGEPGNEPGKKTPPPLSKRPTNKR